MPFTVIGMTIAAFAKSLVIIPFYLNPEVSGELVVQVGIKKENGKGIVF